MILIVIPTIKGREAHLERCEAAYRERTEIPHEVVVIRDAETCGHAWIAGAKFKRRPRYVHLTADDLEPHEGWHQPLEEAVAKDKLPCPVVLNPDSSVQSAGGDLNCPGDLRGAVSDDWIAVDFTTVPFLSLSQYERIGMIPIHYCSDVWVSYRGRQLGLETVLRSASQFTHYNAPEGRLSARVSADRAVMQSELGRYG